MRDLTIITGNLFIMMVRAGNPRYECTLQVACEFPKRKDRLLWESSANSLNGRTDERIRKPRPVGTAAADFPTFSAQLTTRPHKKFMSESAID